MHPDKKCYIEKNLSILKFNDKQIASLGKLLKQVKGIEEFKAPGGDFYFHDIINKENLLNYKENMTIVHLR